METTSGKRNRLYNITIVISLIFGAALIGGLVVFKSNSDYFAGNIQLQQVMESVNSVYSEDDEVSYSKVNIKVGFSDGADSCLIIPLMAQMNIEDISVHEEFTENKYVISLLGYGENVADEIELVGDLDILDAVGVYSQNADVTVEAYCNGVYDYDIVVDDLSVTVKFYELNDRYDCKAVLWTPYLADSLYENSVLEEELSRFATENGIKLYVASELENEYSQDDIVDFANSINADMIIGIDVDKVMDSEPYMVGICNPLYFIPDFDSASLSVKLMEEFTNIIDYEVREFEEAKEDMPIVYKAVVPSAVIRLSVPEFENEYILTENIIVGIENTISSLIAEWRQDDNESE